MRDKIETPRTCLVPVAWTSTWVLMSIILGCAAPAHISKPKSPPARNGFPEQSEHGTWTDSHPPLSSPYKPPAPYKLAHYRSEDEATENELIISTRVASEVPPELMVTILATKTPTCVFTAVEGTPDPRTWRVLARARKPCGPPKRHPLGAVELVWAAEMYMVRPGRSKDYRPAPPQKSLVSYTTTATSNEQGEIEIRLSETDYLGGTLHHLTGYNSDAWTTHHSSNGVTENMRALIAASNAIRLDTPEALEQVSMTYRDVDAAPVRKVHQHFADHLIQSGDITEMADYIGVLPLSDYPTRVKKAYVLAQEREAQALRQSFIDQEVEYLREAQGVIAKIPSSTRDPGEITQLLNAYDALIERGSEYIDASPSDIKDWTNTREKLFKRQRSSWPARESKALRLCRSGQSTIKTFNNTVNSMHRQGDRDALNKYVEESEPRILKAKDDLIEAGNLAQAITGEYQRQGRSSSRFVTAFRKACKR